MSAVEVRLATALWRTLPATTLEFAAAPYAGAHRLMEMKPASQCAFPKLVVLINRAA
jgi:hypothetical protein